MTPMGPGRLSSLFYAQAWVLCHFLWHGENGKYRDKLLDYFESEMHGKSGYRYWAEMWNKDKKWQSADWSELDKEWRAYFDKLCKQMGLR